VELEIHQKAVETSVEVVPACFEDLSPATAAKILLCFDMKFEQIGVYPAYDALREWILPK
jgi:hypothetical protein